MDDDTMMLELAILQLLHPEPLRRREAVELLGDTQGYFNSPPTPLVINSLVPLLQDEDTQVRESAVLSLAQIGAQDILVNHRDKKIEKSQRVLKTLDRVTEPFRK